MDVTIKNVPIEATEKVKIIALQVIEKHLRDLLAPSGLEIQNFENSVNAVYVINDLPKKYKGTK